MPGEKTEQPTPKRLRDAKKKGQVMHSRDASSAFVFIVAVLVLTKLGGGMSEKLQEFMTMMFRMAVSEPFSGKTLEMIRTEGFKTFALVLAPLLGANFMAALMISGIQAGGVLTFEVLIPKFDKLNPLEGIKRIFTMKSLVQLIKATVILTVVCILAYMVVKGSIRSMLLTQRMPIVSSYSFATDLLSTLLVNTAVVLTIVGVADYMFQRWQYMKDMMMSKEDVKNEYKEQEGDPHYKAKRKRMHQEISMGNMLKNARKADVVVVNPIRYAVAIKYDRKERGAPIVVAKGERVMAEKIREIAKEEGIPIMRNVGLTQALMKVEVDDIIPEDLYETVAEVLNWVYKMRREGKV